MEYKFNIEIQKIIKTAHGMMDNEETEITKCYLAYLLR